MTHQGFQIKFNGYTYEYYSSEHEHEGWSTNLSNAVFDINEYIDSLKN